jgi:hypothetical protein
MSEILDQTGWDYSGLVDLVQGDPENGKEVLKQIVEEVSKLEAEMQVIEKQLRSKRTEYNGLLTHCRHLQQHLKWPNPFHYVHPDKVVYSMHITDEGVSVGKIDLL